MLMWIFTFASKSQYSHCGELLLEDSIILSVMIKVAKVPPLYSHCTDFRVSQVMIKIAKVPPLYSHGIDCSEFFK